MGVWIAGLLLIPVGAALSGTTTDVVNSFTVGFQLALLCGLAPFVFRYYLLNDRGFLWTVGTSFLISQCASATVGMMQLAGIQVLDTELIFGRATGLAGHPNVLGLMSALAIIVTAAAFSRLPRPLRIVAVAVIVLNGSALIFTGSLSAMLAVATGVAIALAVKRRLVLTGITVIITIALIAILGSFVGLSAGGLLDPVSSRVNVVLGTSTVEGGAASLDTRLLTYEWAWRYITRDPLIGVGMDATNAGTYNGTTPVHNYVLHAWYRGGIFFFAWQVIATVGYLTLLTRALWQKKDAVPTAILAAVLTFAATSAFYDQQPYWLPLLLAVACFSRRDSQAPPAQPQSVAAAA